MQPFREAIDERVLVCDGAMGTMLYARGVFLNRSFEELNLTQPDLVADLHQAYVRAGADVIETNTFGANRVKLQTFGLADRVSDINVQGARLARRAARDHAYVAGAIGPLGIRVEPFGKTGLDEAEAWFREQAAALLEGDVDLFLLETFRDASELGAAVRAVKNLTDRPIVAQLTTGEDCNTLDGSPPEEFTPRLEAFGTDLIGLNCSVGPAAMLEAIERIASLTKLRLSAQPNAGKPRDVEGRNIYLCSPDYMASYARRFVAAGVRLVGGCCGTTPEHVQLIRQAVVGATPQVRARVSGVRPAEPPHVAAPAPAPPHAVPRGEKSRLANQLCRRDFVVTAQVGLPRGSRSEDVVDRARAFRIRGVDAVQVPDTYRTGARMSPLSVAVLVEQQAGIETVLHYACREHTLLTMQSDLLGAHAMGLRNVMLVTGEATTRGDYPDATSVFDVDSIGLTNAVTQLNRGLDLAGQPIGRPTAFHIGVEVNPAALGRDAELRRYRYKVEAGAEFAVTRPVFDNEDLREFLVGLRDFGIPIILGVRPWTSIREAEMFANEEPGVRVSAALLDRMREAESAGRAADEGLAIARDQLLAVRHLVDGVQMLARGYEPDAIVALTEGLR